MQPALNGTFLPRGKLMCCSLLGSWDRQVSTGLRDRMLAFTSNIPLGATIIPRLVALVVQQGAAAHTSHLRKSRLGLLLHEIRVALAH